MKKIIFLVVICLMFLGCEKSTKNIEISLSSNPTTGYEWTYTIDNGGILKESKNDYLQNESSNEMTGVGGFQIFGFEGKKEGNATITFIYSRTWEKDVEPIYTLTYKINVDKKGKIKETSVTGTYMEEILPEAIKK